MFSVLPPSFALRPSPARDGVFADLGRDDLAQDISEDGTAQLLEYKDWELLAAATVRPGAETTHARVPRRSRLQPYEPDLDAWFADLAAQEGGQ
jgi:hypothetical protein